MATCFLSLFINTNCFVLDTIGNTKKKKRGRERAMSTLTNTYVYIYDGRKRMNEGQLKEKARERERETIYRRPREMSTLSHIYTHQQWQRVELSKSFSRIVYIVSTNTFQPTYQKQMMTGTRVRHSSESIHVYRLRFFLF